MKYSSFFLKKILLINFILAVTSCSKSSTSTPATVTPIVVPPAVTTPIVSRGISVKSSAGNIAYLTDNKFGGTVFNVTNNSWLAINVGSGLTKVFFSWNNPAYSWSDTIAAGHSCKSNLAFPENYTLQTSANSTNGLDGDWAIVLTVTDNQVTARGHAIDITGKHWIKMNITKGGGSLDEIEVFNQAGGITDSWFFVGTSITANTYKATPPLKNFTDLITDAHASYNPAMVRGGIPCIRSIEFAADINKYLAHAGNVKYWAIEMGTNDAWGGSNGNVAAFKANLQTVITACKNAGVTPIIARLLSTNASAAGWQVHADFLTAIDELKVTDSLMAGPDLYTYFINHPDELNSDGVHPNAAGAASIQRLWAEKMTSLY